jgi:hypothetical protein
MMKDHGNSLECCVIQSFIVPPSLFPLRHLCGFALRRCGERF